MQVRSGWNSSYGREKFDVTFEEVDLARLLAEKGISPDRSGELTPGEVFMLMSFEADLFAKRALAAHYEAKADTGGAQQATLEADVLREARDAMLASISHRLGLVTS